MIRFMLVVAGLLLLAPLPGCLTHTGSNGWQVESPELNYWPDPRGEGAFRNHPQILSANKQYHGPVGPPGH